MWNNAYNDLVGQRISHLINVEDDVGEAILNKMVGANAGEYDIRVLEWLALVAVLCVQANLPLFATHFVGNEKVVMY